MSSMGREGGEEGPLTDGLLRVEERPSSVGYGGSSAREMPNGSAVTALLFLSSFIAVCGAFAYGCAAGYSSPVESEIEIEFGLSTAEFSLFGSMLTVGGLLGSLISGRISDFVGRRGAMGLCDIFFFLGWIAIIFSKRVWSLDFGRFFLGVGAGIVIYVVPIYNAEITPKNLRGGLGLLCQLMICSGVSVMFFAGTVITWRILALIGILPCLVQFLGLFFIPESPRYLAKLGRTKEYEAALQRLRGNNVDVSQEAAAIEEYTEALQQISEVNFIYLFQKKYAHALTVALGLMSLAQFGGANGVLFYASEIFESAGFSSTIGSIGMAIIQLPSTALGVFLMDRTGRRPLLLFSSASMCFGCVLVALSFQLKENVWLGNMSPYLVVVGIWVYSATYPLGMGGIPFVVMSEVFPMNVKGVAGSLATVVCWITSWIVSYSFGFMMEWSSPGTFFIIAGVNAFSVLFTAKLVPETKGRSLEEIQESLARIVH